MQADLGIEDGVECTAPEQAEVEASESEADGMDLELELEHLLDEELEPDHIVDPVPVDVPTPVIPRSPDQIVDPVPVDDPTPVTPRALPAGAENWSASAINQWMLVAVEDR